MPDLHRGAVATLTWDLTVDTPLPDTPVPSVAIYLNGTTPALTWTPLAWVAPQIDNGDGTYTRTASLVVAGPDAGGTLPAGTYVLPSMGRFVNWVRLGDGPTERLVGQGELISVLK